MKEPNPTLDIFINSNKNAQQEPIDLSDAAEQKKILSALITDLQKPQKEKTQIVYDPLLRISQLFKVPTEGKQQKQSFLDKVKKLLTCSCIQSKYEQSYKMIAVLFNSLKEEEYQWLERHYHKYSRQELSQLKTEYVQRMKYALTQVHSQVQNEKIHQQAKQTTLKLLNELQTVYDSLELNIFRIFNFQLYKEKNYIFAMMISAFQIFSKQYNTYQRAKLKKIFIELENQSQSVSSSVEVLRFLENKDPVIAKLQPLNQQTLDKYVNEHIADYMKMSRLRIERTNIGLVKVSDSPKRRKVVNLLISGFLSQDQDKKQQWDQLLACMPDSEVYGLQWQSNTINRLVKFLILSIKDLIIGKSVEDLCRKDNPFIPAFQVSIHAGQILAYVVHKMFPYQFVNIIGYSLGSELIRSFVNKSIQLNGGANLNKVILMGGVSDVGEFQKTLSQTHHTINILNCRSKYDSILKHVLKIAKPEIKPVGLYEMKNQLQNHLINNVDLSKKISGHFAYMTNFGVVAEHLALSQQ